MTPVRLVGDQQATVPTTVIALGAPRDPARHISPNNPLPVYTVRSAQAGTWPLGYLQVTDLGTPRNLAVPVGSRYAVMQAEAGPVRWRDDGQPPTAASGMLLMDGDEMTYDSDMSALLVVSADPNLAPVLNVAFYGFPDPEEGVGDA